jgi:thioredoxin 2
LNGKPPFPRRQFLFQNRSIMDKDMIVITCPNCGTKNRVPRDRMGGHARCGKCHSPLPLDMAAPIEITDASFDREVISFPGAIMVEFYSPRCGYSRMLAPVVEELAAEYAGRIRVGRLNVDANPLTSARYAIQGTPTLILFRHGQYITRMVGVMDKRELERALDSIL